MQYDKMCAIHAKARPIIASIFSEKLKGKTQLTQFELREEAKSVGTWVSRSVGWSMMMMSCVSDLMRLTLHFFSIFAFNFDNGTRNTCSTQLMQAMWLPGMYFIHSDNALT